LGEVESPFGSAAQRPGSALIQEGCLRASGQEGAGQSAGPVEGAEGCLPMRCAPLDGSRAADKPRLGRSLARLALPLRRVHSRSDRYDRAPRSSHGPLRASRRAVRSSQRAIESSRRALRFSQTALRSSCGGLRSSKSPLRSSQRALSGRLRGILGVFVRGGSVALGDGRWRGCLARTTSRRRELSRL
jgi:hypothetical protein